MDGVRTAPVQEARGALLGALGDDKGGGPPSSVTCGQRGPQLTRPRADRSRRGAVEPQQAGPRPLICVYRPLASHRPKRLLDPIVGETGLTFKAMALPVDAGLAIVVCTPLVTAAISGSRAVLPARTRPASRHRATEIEHAALSAQPSRPGNRPAGRDRRSHQ